MNYSAIFTQGKFRVALITLVLVSLVLISGCGGSSTPPAAPAAAPKAAAPAPAPAATGNTFKLEIPAEVGSKKIAVVETDYYVDAINDKPHKDQPVSVDRGTKISIAGWAVDRAGKVAPQTIYVKLTADAGGKEYYLKAERIKRPDVAKSYNIPAYETAGFIASGEVKDLAPGSYTVGILQIGDKQAIALTSKAKLVVR